MRIISGIYVIRNKISNKFYIGSSRNIQKRFQQHRNDLNNNRHSNIYLQRAWNKNKSHSFEFKILERCDNETLLDREQFWIDKLNAAENGYNMCRNTTSPMLGRTFSDETKKRMAKAQTGRKHTEETKRKMSESQQGRKFSQSHIENMSQSRKGRKASEETRAKLRIVHANPSAELRYKFGNANRGKKLPIAQVEKSARSRMQRFIVTTPDGDDIEIMGLAKFCRENGLDQGTMSRAMKKGHMHKGWKCRKVE